MLGRALPEKAPLLAQIGGYFATVGLCAEAHLAYLHGGEVMAAVDTCVLLNEWELAVDLAQKHNFVQIEGLLTKYASHLLEKQKKLEAVQLYRKANRNTEAAQILVDIAKSLGPVSREPLLCKKLYLLAALEMEKYRKRTMPQLDGTTTAVQTTLNSLITQDQSTMTSSSLEKPWRGVEACHFYVLAQRFLFERREDLAMCCAVRCTEYEDILDTLSIYSLLALAAYYNKFYNLCSKAFIRLENSKDIPENDRKKYARLAVSIFTKHSPVDPSTRVQSCPKCQGSMQEWQSNCSHCSHQLSACVISGRPIFTSRGASGTETGSCKGCRRRYYISEVGSLQNCPLCHTALPETMKYRQS